MTSRWMIAVVPLLVLCVASFAQGAEETGLVVDSPFDLTLGSTNYAARLGKAVHSSANAWYDPDTKVTTTNWSVYASVRFAKPYHGATRASLQFKGEDRALDSFSFEIGEKKYGVGGKLTVDEARKIMQEVSADITKRFGVKMVSSRFGEGDLSDADIDRRIEEMIKGGPRKDRMFATSFAILNGNGERDGVAVGYSVTGMVDRKKKCSVGVRVHTPWRPKQKDADMPIGETSIPGLVSEAEQKKAHEEAKGLREALGKLFKIDFDSAKGYDNADGKNALEWSSMENPVAGLDECKPNRGMTSFFQIPIVNYWARRAYPGDVEEPELQHQAKEVLDCIEAAYGSKIPAVDAKERQAELDKMLGTGVPTFGDSRALLGLDKTQAFVGKVGDLAVEIAYALPRYEKKGDGYQLVRRAAVLLSIFQSPIITPSKVLTGKTL